MKIRHFIEKPVIAETWKTREHIAVYKAWGRWTSELPSHTLKNISEERKKYLDHYYGTSWYYNTPDTVYPADDARINIPTIILAGNITASAAEDFLKEISEKGKDKRYGIKPDIDIQPTVQNIIENKDPVLEKAVEFFNDKTNRR